VQVLGLAALVVAVLVPVGGSPARAAAATTFGFVDYSNPDSLPGFSSTNVSASGTSTDLTVTLGVGFRVEVRPAAGHVLGVGTYQGATAFLAGDPLGSSPGIGPYTLCGVPGFGATPRPNGWFAIDDIAFAPDGSVDRVAIRFEARCDVGSDQLVYGALGESSTHAYPTRTFSMASVRFPNSAPGSVVAPIQFTVTNDGMAPLVIASPLALSGPDAGSFTLDASACAGKTLAPTESCTLVVGFVPTGNTGVRHATVQWFDTITPLGSVGRPIAIAGPVEAADGEYTPLTPARVLDTRDGTGRGGVSGALGDDDSFDVQITGRGGVPVSGVSAVVLNATVAEPTATSFLTLWPTGVARPLISNLNYVAGQTVPNLVTVAVGAGGRVSVYNHTGATQVIFDVVGFYASASGPAGGRFQGISPPVRVVDTRSGQGEPAAPIGAGATLAFHVPGQGIPFTAVTAVVLNVTITDPSAPSFLTVFPDDVTRPLASNLNFTPGLTVPNLVIVRVPASGNIDFYNHSGTTDLVVDVMGYYTTDKYLESGRLVTGTPVRIFDSRVASPYPPPGAMQPSTPLVLAPTPADSTAFVINVTVTDPTSPGWVAVFPNPSAPSTSNLNFVAGQTVPNLVMVGAGYQGQIDVYLHALGTNVVIDLFGIFSGPSYPPAGTANGAELDGVTFTASDHWGT
jgi:hypothetical protein